MKKTVGLMLVGVALGVGVFFLRRETVSFFTSALDALTLSGGTIVLFSLLGCFLNCESADGICYAVKAGFLGLFPFGRAQSFRLFKEERREKRKKTGLDKESLCFGGSLFLIGGVLSFLGA